MPAPTLRGVPARASRVRWSLPRRASRFVRSQECRPNTHDHASLEDALTDDRLTIAALGPGYLPSAKFRDDKVRVLSSRNSRGARYPGPRATSTTIPTHAQRTTSRVASWLARTRRRHSPLRAAHVTLPAPGEGLGVGGSRLAKPHATRHQIPRRPLLRLRPPRLPRLGPARLRRLRARRLHARTPSSTAPCA